VAGSKRDVEWKGDKVSAEENKAISRRADAELFDRGTSRWQTSASNFVYHNPLSGEDWHGPESVKQYAAMMRAAFPDLYYIVEDQVAEGDKGITRYAASGTHQGELMGIAPTEERVELRGISIIRVNGGKIEKIWENYVRKGAA
jgi:predicted ester cyclase